MADQNTGEAKNATLSETATLSENRRLRHLVEALSLSLALQSDRAAAEAGAAYGWRTEAQLLRASLFWRATAPARLAVDLARGRAPLGLPLRQGFARARAIAADEGWVAAWQRARAWLRRHRPPKADLVASRPNIAPDSKAPDTATAAPSPYALPLSAPPGRTLTPKILIIAELTLPQCAKYRVWQKQEHIRSLGIACEVVNWHDVAGCRTAASLATAVILYRVPGFPNVLRMIDELKRLRLPIWWEVDDLIFDAAEYLQNRNLASLDDDLRESILSGVPLYRSAMLACGRGIASTARLARAMRDAGLQEVHIVENALDAETLAIAAELRQTARRQHIGTIITYGSGTRTHDADFAVVEPGLLAVMRARPDVRLRIVGDLRLSKAFADVANRIEPVPKTHYAAYLKLLAESDISIAPLEATVFNDAKSNIKFLEAAMLGLASVCSPCATFAEVVEHGVNGMLASDDAGWESSLLALIEDVPLRRRIGEAALQTARDRYAPAAVAQRQVAPLFADLETRDAMPLRVLMANVYFWPKSFGGATIVAEEMARRLHARGDTIVHVVTGAEDMDAADMDAGQAMLRYEMPLPGQAPMMIAALAIPGPDAILPFDNPSAGRVFGKVLDAVRPNVVHLHSIQGLSATLARACIERAIPYVITLHDAWWLCTRQFMVQADGRYCFQRQIDIKVCEACVPGTAHLRQRFDLLMLTLRGAALLLSPSESHRQLYLAQGLDPSRIVVAPNGVRFPARGAVTGRARQPPLTFAYVGGNVDVKGYPLVKAAFEALDRADWRLVVVDNTLNLGFSSIHADHWKVRGVVQTVAAYTQDTIDTLFAGIDVLVFPSQWKESFGLTVREALLRGVWVIATEGGGPAEAIDDGVNGTLIPLDGRHENLLRAVENLLDNPASLTGALPRTGKIIDFSTQAEQLHGLLTKAAATGHGKAAA